MQEHRLDRVDKGKYDVKVLVRSGQSNVARIKNDVRTITNMHNVIADACALIYVAARISMLCLDTKHLSHKR